MKPTNQVRKDGSSSSVGKQVQAEIRYPAKPRPVPAVVSPSAAADALSVALDIMQDRVNAAETLAVMFTDEITHAVKHYAGWKNFGEGLLQEGAPALAHLVGSRLRANFLLARAHCEPVIKLLSECHNELPTVARASVAGRDLPWPGASGTYKMADLEEALYGLQALLQLSAEMLDRRGGEYCFLFRIPSDELYEAFEALMHAYRLVDLAWLAVEASRRDQQQAA